MEEQFCVNGGRAKGSAGRRFIKPALPNAANSIAHPRKDEKKNVYLRKSVTGSNLEYEH